MKKTIPNIPYFSLFAFLFIMIMSMVFCKNSKMKIPPTNSLNSSDVYLDFNDDQPGHCPEYWQILKAGNGGNGEWMVINDTTSDNERVFAQISKRSLGYHYHLAILNNYFFDDITISLSLKMYDGQEEQAGGPVWHFQDKNNFYTCLSDPLKQRLRVYKVEQGEKRLLASAWASKIESHEWERLKIWHHGNHIKCWFDDKKYIDIRDDTFRQGRAGLCTKADAVVFFDNIHFSPVK